MKTKDKDISDAEEVIRQYEENRRRNSFFGKLKSNKFLLVFLFFLINAIVTAGIVAVGENIEKKIWQVFWVFVWFLCIVFSTFVGFEMSKQLKNQNV